MRVNSKGHLTVAGLDTVELAKTFGTPLYVMDEAVVRENCRLYKNAVDQNYNGHGMVFYASKALCIKEMCRIIESEGLGLDVVSGGELYTAISIGFPMDRIMFHGNFKTEAEIEMGVVNDVGRFVIDNLYEAELINTIAKKYGKTVKALLRVSPGTDAHTHEFIMTGQIDSKFGTPIEGGAAEELIGKILELKNINLAGLHCHIGSQIFELEPFNYTARVMLNFMADIDEKFSIKMTELDLGGGFGIRYIEDHDPIPYEKYMESIADTVDSVCKERNLDRPYIMMEPGRSIVGSAGLTLYTVGSIKEIKDVRNYVAIDGGLPDNPRYALYGAQYDVLVASKANKRPDFTATIAGRCCESGDLIQENVSIAKPEPGDTVAVLDTGAYNYSMASNYNRVPRPAMVFIRNGQARLVLNRESYDDMLKNDL
ncbi:MAG: diaminopimelate decarboxylase [Bacillota bacterium]|nr:diaminopimelate decarboxylase [Bacillota bacterium]